MVSATINKKTGAGLILESYDEIAPFSKLRSADELVECARATGRLFYYDPDTGEESATPTLIG